jgi:hypothetical protein
LDAVGAVFLAVWLILVLLAGLVVLVYIAVV